MSVPDRRELERAAATGTSTSVWARHLPDEVAISSIWGERTFAELDAEANRLARAMRRHGIGPGSHLAIVCGNRPEFAAAVFASLRNGTTYTPVNWHLTPDEVAHIVDDCGATVVIGDARWGDTVSAATARSERVVLRLAIGGDIDGYRAWSDVVDAEDGTELDDPVLGNRMLYTSGTTGRPKGVLRPPGYSTGLTALTSAPDYRAGTQQRHLCTGPLHHGGPLGFSLVTPLSSGVGTVLMDRWDAAQALRLIESERITHTHMVPTMFHRLLQLPDEVRDAADVSSLTYVLHGAAPCPVATKRRIIDWFGPVVWEYFAATEGAGASISSEEWLRRPGSVGRPPGPDHVLVVDDDGHPCPAGTAGELRVRRDPASDFEYFGDPAKTAAARRGDHFTIGDIGYLDDDGYLYVTDRTADVIVRGGVNVYPAEVEAVLLAHPSVEDAGVVGIPDEDLGEQVAAAVMLDPAATVTVEELTDWCQERLASFKVPRRVDLVDDLPRLDNGKLYRHRLRDRYRPATTVATTTTGTDATEEAT